MRLSLLLAPILVLGSGPVSAQEAKSWSVVSDDAKATGEQVAEGKGCRFTAKKDGAVVWTAARCLAEKQDLRFLSNDGKALLVLFPFPDSARGIKAARAGELWRQGKRVASWTVGQMVKDVKPLVTTSRHFYWLEGGMGQPGVPPGLAADGRAVELSTLDRRSFRLGFDGSLKPSKAADPLKAAKQQP